MAHDVPPYMRFVGAVPAFQFQSRILPGHCPPPELELLEELLAELAELLAELDALDALLDELDDVPDELDEPVDDALVELLVLFPDELVVDDEAILSIPPAPPLPAAPPEPTSLPAEPPDPLVPALFPSPPSPSGAGA